MEENNDQKLSMNQIYEQVTTLLVKENKSIHEVREYLLELGLTEEGSQTIIGNVAKQIDKVREAKSNKDIMYGLLWGGAGGLVTWISYSMASREGGIFIITWGAIIYGFFLIFKGLFNKYLVKRIISKEQKENKIHSNKQRGENAILFLKSNILFSIIFLILVIWQYQIIQELSPNSTKPIDILSTPMQIQSLVSVGFVFITIICGIMFLLWFKRAYHNLHQVNSTLKYKEKWAIWGWFIPIINLWRPYQIMKEIYIHATTQEKKNNASDEEEIITTPIIDAWWLLWIASGIFSQIINRLPKEDISQLESLYILSILAFSILIIDAVLLIKIIKKCLLKEQEIFEQE